MSRCAGLGHQQGQRPERSPQMSDTSLSNSSSAYCIYIVLLCILYLYSTPLHTVFLFLCTLYSYSYAHCICTPLNTAFLLICTLYLFSSAHKTCTPLHTVFLLLCRRSLYALHKVFLLFCTLCSLSQVYIVPTVILYFSSFAYKFRKLYMFVSAHCIFNAFIKYLQCTRDSTALQI